MDLFSVIRVKLIRELHSADKSIVFPAGSTVEVQFPIGTEVVTVQNGQALGCTLGEITGSEMIEL